LATTPTFSNLLENTTLWRSNSFFESAYQGLTLVHLSAQPQPFLTQNAP
jgi:hypothetical protein